MIIIVFSPWLLSVNGKQLYICINLVKMLRKNAKKSIIKSILIITLFLFFWINRNSYIKSYGWKLNSSNKISDYIEFIDDKIQIKGKSIVLNEKKYGTILICVYKYLVVTNNKGQVCFYVNDGLINNNKISNVSPTAR